MPAKDVVAKGAAQGMKLSEKYVYNIRSSNRGKKGPRRGPGRPPKAARGRPPKIGRRATRTVGRGRGRPRAGGDLDQQLRATIAELGLARSRAVFEEVAAAFGG
jgi:hypothetical protein